MASFLASFLFLLTLAVGARAEVPHYPAPSELANEALHFDGGIVLGNPQGDVTIVEFFDYNCPYCRRAAQDMATLLKEDPNLKFVLINYAVLGVPSIEAARIALAFAQQKPALYAKFHSDIYATRGRVDGDKAIATALALGADRKTLLDDANSAAVTGRLKHAAKLGGSLGLEAMPSFVILTEAFVGDPGLAALRKIIASVRQCEKTACP
jgi:protein-disulfide isomerase